MGTIVLNALGLAAVVIAGLVLLGAVIYFAVVKPLEPWLNKRDREALQMAVQQKETSERTTRELGNLVRSHGLTRKQVRELL